MDLRPDPDLRARILREELEEWRLTGDHLRFRIGPTWLAVGLPAREHAGVRELLLERRPEAESRFSR